MPPADVAAVPAGPRPDSDPATGGPSPGRLARLTALPWPALALIALALATFVGFLVYPTYPNYDSYYSLLWGREVLHGHLPSFDEYRSPTEHPLAVLFGAALSLLGRGGDRVMVFCTEASFVVLCAGVYRLARRAFTPLVGLAAAGILCTRFDFPFLAARAYIDIPYLAFVVWAAALELERPRRGGIVWVLLACAGLLRPEAWILIGLYFLWMCSGELGPGHPRGERLRRWARYAAWAAVGPVVWVATDFVVTGHPFFSLQHTSGLAEELGRTQGLSEVPSSMKRFFFNLAKAPVLYAAIAGFLAALWLAPRRAIMPAVLWLIGTGTFVLVGIAGLSVIDRYLLVPTLMVMVFAAVALAGWSMLRKDALIRKVWAVAAGLIVIYGVVFSATRVNFHVFDSELQLRGASHRSLADLLDQPAVRAARRCGPVTVPNHKLVPDTRWLLGASAGEVLARADPAAEARKQKGVSLFVVDRGALLRQALVADTDDPFDNIPLSGFRRLAFTPYYSAYVRC
ncbi:MAG TPA: hypothetical protein VK501_25135 [Baekduia sp.]|uniref:hypothetical protein n=1 Tax=Baekduia sp. TaxID=2600305 RepID=UPI002C03BEC7|nr:hypothetical protein [Baekduia sp.]HMJ37213.1 hypothetical protein [Baekduia sp.]